MGATSASYCMSRDLDSCVFYAKPAGEGNFYWGWHSANGRKRSRRVFAYFYDCLVDARHNGYEVDPARIAAQLHASKLTIQVVPKITQREPQT